MHDHSGCRNPLLINHLHLRKRFVCSSADRLRDRFREPCAQSGWSIWASSSDRGSRPERSKRRAKRASCPMQSSSESSCPSNTVTGEGVTSLSGGGGGEGVPAEDGGAGGGGTRCGGGAGGSGVDGRVFFNWASATLCSNLRARASTESREPTSAWCISRPGDFPAREESPWCGVSHTPPGSFC